MFRKCLVSKAYLWTGAHSNLLIFKGFLIGPAGPILFLGLDLKIFLKISLDMA